MTLWIALGVMTALAVGLLLPALLRRSNAVLPRAEYDVRVYRDQLAEIERDAARGLIEPEQAQAARTEIGRRLIAAGEAAKDAAAAAPPRSRGHAAAAAIAVFVPAAALALYFALGSPDLAVRGPAPQTASQGRSMEALVADLGERLKSRPNDAKGWSLYATSLSGLGRHAESLSAFEKALALAPNNAELASRYAEAQIVVADGRVTPAARATLDQVLALEPKEPRARYYRALADRQAGLLREALDRWIALESESTPGAPWRPAVAARIEETAKLTGIDDAALAAMRDASVTRAPQPAPAPSTAQPRGPTADDMAAAARMSADDRAQMIRGMVEGLAARLDAQPDDFDGWMRLARARSVLGETDKAQEAYRRAAALRPKDADALTLWLEAMADTAPKDGPIPAELGALAERILAIDPARQEALWYAGAAKAAAGDASAARDRWQRLLATLDPTSPQHAELRRRIDSLGSPAPNPRQ